MENPAAVAAIGAGIGWKLWKNPPVASALVGYGLFSSVPWLGSMIRCRMPFATPRGRIEETTSAVFQYRDRRPLTTFATRP